MSTLDLTPVPTVPGSDPTYCLMAYSHLNCNIVFYLGEGE